jgi:hypothetical protein
MLGEFEVHGSVHRKTMEIMSNLMSHLFYFNKSLTLYMFRAYLAHPQELTLHNIAVGITTIVRWCGVESGWSSQFVGLYIALCKSGHYFQCWVNFTSVRRSPVLYHPFKANQIYRYRK